MLRAAGGRIAGKTLVQKQCYFLNQLCGLGMLYIPHYYGPHSPELDVAIEQAKALGFVSETVAVYGPDHRTGFEAKRFDYSLTEDGRASADWICERDPDTCRRIESYLEKVSGAGNPDYVELSIAAKAFHVLSGAGERTTPAQIWSKARRFGWSASEAQVDEAISAGALQV